MRIRCEHLPLRMRKRGAYHRVNLPSKTDHTVTWRSQKEFSDNPGNYEIEEWHREGMKNVVTAIDKFITYAKPACATLPN